MVNQKDLMKKSVMLAAMMLAAVPLMAADPKDEVTNAAKKLADADNYSWHSGVENAGATVVAAAAEASAGRRMDRPRKTV